MELVGATNEVSQATDNLLKSLRTFEIQKRNDVKTSLSEMLWSEINYHARALEILTKYHNYIGEVTFEEDILVRFILR